jgi:hypothetical protein
VLRAVLPDKGYTAHVLGFTAAALLQAHVAAGISAGQLDEALPLLLPTLDGDLFGSVSGVLSLLFFLCCPFFSLLLRWKSPCVSVMKVSHWLGAVWNCCCSSVVFVLLSSGISAGLLNEALPLLLPTLDGDLFVSVSGLLFLLSPVCCGCSCFWMVVALCSVSRSRPWVGGLSGIIAAGLLCVCLAVKWHQRRPAG